MALFPSSAARLSPALGSALLACALFVLDAPGCGTGERPPILGDTFSAPLDAGGQREDESGLRLVQTVPTCNLGPEGGVCGCADQPLVTDVPNIYFVLDRSASMNDLNKWTTVRTVLADIVVQLGPRAKFGVTVFPDPSEGGCARASRSSRR